MDAQVKLSSFTDPSVLGSISSTLSGVGIDPTSVQAAQSAYELLPHSVQGAVGDVLDSYSALPSNVKQMGGDIIAGALHGNVSITSMMPLVSMGLAETGVGAPVAGLVAAAVPILGAVGNLLDGSHPPATDRCAWIVKSTANVDPSWLSGGSMTMPSSDDDMKKFGYTPESFGCFNKKRPYGPSDPAWVKFAAYVKKNQKIFGNGHFAVLFAFANQMPGYTNDWTIIYNDLRDLANFGNKNYSMGSDDGRKFQMVPWNTQNPGGNQIRAGYLYTAPLAVRQFAALYFYMWQANAEMAINGHKFASDKDILVAALQAWNLRNKGGPTVTIKPGDKWFLGYLLNGDIDGNDETPITLPTAIVAPPPAAKKNIAFHMGKPVAKPASPVPAHQTTVHVTAAGKPVVVAVEAPWWKKYVPYAPVAVGAALLPVLGPIAPLAGGAATVWLKFGKK